MPRIRLFLAWLLLVALPLQGLAAAGLQTCRQLAHAPSAVATAAAGAAAHHHDAPELHRGHHGHAVHDSAVHAQGAAQASDSATTAADFAASPDAGHSCGVCASFCHGVGVTSQSEPMRLAAGPRVAAAEPVTRVNSVPPSVPDKPPRA